MNAPLDKPIETEEDLLRAEAARARIALHDALLGVKRSLVRTADPVQWASSHPWISVGVAAATGFAAASAIVPAPGQRMTNKWGDVIQRFSPHSKTPAPDVSHTVQEGSSEHPTPTLWTSLIDALFEIAKVIVSNAITTMKNSKNATTAEYPSSASASNGDSAELRAD
jgi:hypothetical protein